MQLFVYNHNSEETVDLHKCILMLNLSTEQFAAFDTTFLFQSQNPLRHYTTKNS